MLARRRNIRITIKAVLTWSCNSSRRVHCRMQLFDKVDGKVTPGRGRKRILDFYLKTSTYPEIKSFTVNGSTLLPPEVLPPTFNHQYTIFRQRIKLLSCTLMWLALHCKSVHGVQRSHLLAASLL
jgi:hypothetical protein